MVGKVQGVMRSGEVELLSGGEFEGKGLTEGPVWHPRGGYVTFVRHHLNTLYRWTPETGETSVLRDDTNHGNGCTLDKEGRILMCEGNARRITRREHDGSITTVTDAFDGRRYNKPNDIICRSDGSVYFTDPAARVKEGERQLGFSGVFQITPDGDVRVATDECGYPNGLAFSPDESVLYIAITRRDMNCLDEGVKGSECRHREIRAFDVTADGGLRGNRRFAELYTPKAGGPDGLKVDTAGRVFCASAGGIWVFDPSGVHLGTIETPAKARNLAFGGPDLRTLYICAGESLFRTEMEVPGIAGPW